MCEYMYAYMSICAYIYTNKNLYVHIFMHIYVRICLCVYTLIGAFLSALCHVCV